MKRIKPSGAQFRKTKIKKIQSAESSKNLMKAFIERSSSLKNQGSHEVDPPNRGSSSSTDEGHSKDDNSGENNEGGKVSDSNNVNNLTETSATTSELNIIPETLLELQKNSEEENPLRANEHDDKRLPITQSDNFSMDVLQDIGRWPENIAKQFRDLVVSQGTSQLQNKDSVFPSDTTGRSMNKCWFEKLLKNGRKINRSWLCYSPCKNALFCVCCTLFKQKNYQSSFSSVSGFSTWRKLNPRIQNHETSAAHRSAFMEWKELERSLNKGPAIDSHLQRQVCEAAKIWKEILERVIATVQTLAQQNLALRGHRESITDSANPGNFLALIKYLAKFDPVMRTHLDSVSGNPGKLSYLSPDIQNEIISILGEQVRKTIIAACKKAKYYSIMFDTTPDQSHEEQMSQIIRFVDIDEQSVEVRESFIDFIPVHDKTAAGITEVITSKLEEDGLDLKDCRGQSFDNQATMAGIHTGVQKRILELNPLAIFVPCDNHSLNLVGVHAAHVNPQAITFFGILEKLFTFFSCSTHRWSVLKEHVNITIKRHAETRWSSKADAVKAVSSQLNEIIACLEKLRDTPSETVETREDAAILINGLETFDFICLLYFWAEILPAINHSQKVLQIEGVSFHSALLLLQTLEDQLGNWRTNLCDIVIEKSVKKCEEWGVETDKRPRKKRKMPGEHADDVVLNSRQEIKRCLIEIIDKLSAEMRDRFTHLSELEKRFGYLCEIENHLKKGISEEKLSEHCKILAENYPHDIDFEELLRDTKDVLLLLKRATNNGEKLNLKPKGLLTYINSMGAESYKSLATALQILLTIPVSVASCERSFSKLKLIKNYLRSTMTENRLTNLAVLSIEHETASLLDYSKVISDFAAAKARKVKF